MGADPLSEIADQNRACVHATCVSVNGAGALIIGASGTGKSSLALQMMALGAQLVADDQVELAAQGGQVMADAVPRLHGLIEARGLGLLKAESTGPVPVAYLVDLDQGEPVRLPESAEVQILKQTVPLLRAAAVPNLAAVLMQILKMGRVSPEWPNP